MRRDIQMIYEPSKLIIKNLGKTLLLSVLTVAFLSATIHAQDSSGQGKEIEADRQLEIIDSVTSVLNEEYVFPDLTEQLEAHLRDRYDSGAYQDIGCGEAFTSTLSRDLQAISKDLHLRVYYYPDEYFDTQLDQEPDQEEIERRLREDQRDNFTFRKVEILPGNVGYLEFDRFRNAKDAAPTATAALNFLGHCDALIIDLRDNGGGEPNMVKLIMSYFFDEEILFNDLYDVGKDEHNQLWTQAYIPGPRMSQCDVYVLISYDTFSAGEALAYHLKHSGRATLVGSRTPGGAHDCEFHNCTNLNIRIKVPCRKAISPFTGTNWEGVGVAPDIEVPCYKAYDVAYLEAVKGIRARTTDKELLAELDWILPVLESNLNPVIVSEDVLRSYVGMWGPGKITYDHATLLMQMPNRRPMKLLAMSPTMFWCPEMIDNRLEFHPDADGNTNSVTVHTSDGRAFDVPRSK
jgi:hypothetical protein